MKKLVQITLLLLSVTAVLAQNYSGGNGTSGDPYLIANKADLKYLSENLGEWSKHFKQTADITFSDADFQSGGDFYNSGAGFIPLGSNWGTTFSGSYDGGGHKITNLFISRGSTDFVGFFGLLSGTLTNLGLENANITGGGLTGGLVGRNQNSISNCYLTGSVSGTSNVGGIVGYCASTVSNCYSTGTITGSSEGVGGIAGLSFATITNCYAIGSVSGTSYAGLLMGANGGTINNSFWNSDISATGVGGGFGGSTGASGRSTAEMKVQSTFTTAGWDFANTWAINGSINNGYPYIQPPPLYTNNTS